MFTGSVPSTGASTQAMTSYLPAEITWGHRFSDLVATQQVNGKYLFNYTKFDAIIPVNTTSQSAAQLANVTSQPSPHMVR